ncbi:uncharacterized protein K452DRAFT_50983 [Aplosporella prunicola CBS 121167]|uniref:Uncharacterized protein n=1 Tax=Aplosporella prunicola CBS 121167 TaxID=1176127 RepID=A0A6A6BCY7_9PEZI|nr:uncharacterized protein K452DRAFT_50983 [Aplosporella prunicola CBS 121167]KAF2140767.1 hypothetical protein K452DRAFT_50983 [Aplosporella prunicola CBS 121167]
MPTTAKRKKQTPKNRSTTTHHAGAATRSPLTIPSTTTSQHPHDASIPVCPCCRCLLATYPRCNYPHACVRGARRHNDAETRLQGAHTPASSGPHCTVRNTPRAASRSAGSIDGARVFPSGGPLRVESGAGAGVSNRVVAAVSVMRLRMSVPGTWNAIASRQKSRAASRSGRGCVGEALRPGPVARACVPGCWENVRTSMAGLICSARMGDPLFLARCKDMRARIHAGQLQTATCGR